MSKKQKIIISISIVLLILIGGISAFLFLNKEEKIEKSPVEVIEVEEEIKQEEKTKTIEDIMMEIQEKDIDSLRDNISVDDIALMQGKSYTGETNSLAELGDMFFSSLQNFDGYTLTEKKDGGIGKDFLETELEKFPLIYKRNFELNLDIYDKLTEERISKGTVYVNGINMGDFEDGKAVKNFEWLKGIESFNILVRSDEYGDAMTQIYSINSEGGLLLGKVFMKKAIIEEIEIGVEQELSFSGVSIKLNDCSLVKKSGECYKGNAKVKVNYIGGEDANEGFFSLNRKGITKEGKIVYLRSGGMAFFEFIVPDGEILQLKKGETIEITYKLSNEDIENMDQRTYGRGEKNGYWWYNKNTSLWQEEDVLFSLSRENKTWTAKVSHLY